MAHELDMTNGRANIAYLGKRQDVWHHLGQEMPADASIDTWAKQAGLDWTAIKVPALADLTGPQWSHLAPQESVRRLRPVERQNFICRSDNGYPLGYVSEDIYQPVQPRDLLDWFQRYISVDSRFKLDVAGSLKHGRQIWATATFLDDATASVAGDRHVMRLLMTTSFDGSRATINQGTVTRVVCANTLHVALCDHKAVIRTRHNTRFDAAKVGRELGAIAQGFARYKAVGDALVQNEMAAQEVSNLFKQLLDIPFDVKREDISARKSNQFQALSNAYRATVAEGTPQNTAWAALNAVTRYVDHDKSVRGNGISAAEKQFTSAQFGSGAGMKAHAMGLLMPRIKDRVPVLAA